MRQRITCTHYFIHRICLRPQFNQKCLFTIMHVIPVSVQIISSGESRIIFICYDCCLIGRCKISLQIRIRQIINVPSCIQITQTIEQIELLDRQLFHTELEMANIVTCLNSVIMTIPGIGTTNGGMILGEIGDIHRFSSPGKLLAFAGLDPSVYQSGNFQAKKTRMSKRGSRVLRYALMNAAHNVVKNNATFKAYYDAKRAEGRTHYNALGHCAGKLVRVIWKMLTDNVEFNLE